MVKLVQPKPQYESDITKKAYDSVEAAYYAERWDEYQYLVSMGLPNVILSRNVAIYHNTEDHIDLFDKLIRFGVEHIEVSDGGTYFAKQPMEIKPESKLELLFNMRTPMMGFPDIVATYLTTYHPDLQRQFGCCFNNCNAGLVAVFATRKTMDEFVEIHYTQAISNVEQYLIPMLSYTVRTIQEMDWDNSYMKNMPFLDQTDK